jgi:hypothetical protein
MGSVRDRNLVSKGQDHSSTTDFSNRSWGTMQATSKATRGSTVIYYLTCSVCHSSGATISQEALSRGETPHCLNSGCGKTSTDVRRQAEFGEDRGPQSPRERAEYAARQAAIANLGGAE